MCNDIVIGLGLERVLRHFNVLILVLYNIHGGGGGVEGGGVLEGHRVMPWST